MWCRPRAKPLRFLAALVLVAPSACGGGGGGEASAPIGPQTLRVQSTAFAEAAKIPKKNTCDGENVSPPLAWTGVPDSAKALALLCEDPDAPGGLFTHWVLYSLPPSLTELNEAIPPGESAAVAPDASAAQGKNDFGKLGYGGPCPPRGTHRYQFRLFALDSPLSLKPGATRSQLLAAIKGHVLAEGRLTGTYER